MAAIFRMRMPLFSLHVVVIMRATNCNRESDSEIESIIGVANRESVDVLQFCISLLPSVKRWCRIYAKVHVCYAACMSVTGGVYATVTRTSR